MWESRSARADFFSNAKRIRIPHDDVPAGTAVLPSFRYIADMSKILDEAMDAVRALPATEQAACEILTLPCYAELEEEEISAVAGALQALALEAHVA